MQNQYKKLLAEIKDVIEVLEESVDNPHSFKFFLGKLHLTTKALMDLYLNNN